MRLPAALTSRAFAVGFGVAALVLVIASARMLLGGDPASASGRVTLVILGLNLVLVLGLGLHLGRRFWRLFFDRAASDPAPRLHLRFAGLFSLVAIVPAVVVAVLLGALFTRGMESWFSERTLALVDTAAKLGDQIQRVEGDNIGGHVLAMALDLNERADLLQESRITYTEYLAAQAQYREFVAAYVIDSASTVLARAEAEGAPAFVAPSREAFRTADEGDVNINLVREKELFEALFKLENYDDAYLYVVRQLRLAPFLRDTEASIVTYREALASRGRLRAVYAFLYLETALLVLVGAAGFGLSAANQVVRPVGRLVKAAARVRDGDLSARVTIESTDELGALARAFNEMTSQLASQHKELVEAKSEAETRREFTEAVLSGVSAGVLGVDARNEVTLANRSALALLGAASEADVIGHDVTEVAPELAGIVRSARAATSNVAEGQADLMRKGDMRRLNVRAAASRDGSGAVVATFDDITRLVTDQRNAAWRDVARRIAHEIRNPLTPIQLSAERLRRKYLKEIQGDREVFGRCVDTIVRQVSDIGRMVDEFSAFARMPGPRPSSVEMGELVRAAAFTQRVASPNIDVQVEAPDSPVTVFCDERLITQALANVLKNAAEALAEREQEAPGAKSPAALIKVTLQARDDGFAVVEVVDNGVGWPDAPREQLAEPYMTTREKGTGLGLAIVKRVMEDHHGRLELADRADGERGAMVRLVLPLHARLGDAPAEQDERATA